MQAHQHHSTQQPGELIHIQGVVQGVGFRPTVARLAREQQLLGWVRNTPEGVLLALATNTQGCDLFLETLQTALPPLARISHIRREPVETLDVHEQFTILPSTSGNPKTSILSDVATCDACHKESRNPYERRFRYPFTNCTHCGPRYSIIQTIPYDRSHTTMSAFPMCDACKAEYDDETDRRFHAQPIACHVCGPKAWLARADGKTFSYTRFSMLDEVDAVNSLLMQGEIVAIKGLGGFQLCCDATREDAVDTLRNRKHRPHKPLAMMVPTIDVLKAYAHPTEEELEAIQHPAGPIVLMTPNRSSNIAPNVAPDQSQCGFMLPTTPLHALMIARMKRPIVCTSGNVSTIPQCIDNQTAKEQLGNIADWFLFHDRDIAQRVDDSVVRVMSGQPRVIRYARGYAPLPLPLPKGLTAPPILAMGGQQKSSFCLLSEQTAVLSPYLGDLDTIETLTAWQETLDAMMRLRPQKPSCLVVDMHEGYEASKMGRGMAQARSLPLIEVQHHHAHVVSCIAEHQRPLDAPPVLGIVLDGLGLGTEGQLWGGEFLLADYRSFTRLGTFKPVAMLGGNLASKEPWRNLYAHLMAEMGWTEFELNFDGLEIFNDLAERPRKMLDKMLETSTNSPLASSCGRLFDAVAAALGLFRDGIEYEGQAAMALEALATPQAIEEAKAGEVYPFAIPLLHGKGLPYIEPLAMWRALLGDLWEGCAHSLIAARFHLGLGNAILHMAHRCQQKEPELQTAVLSGGVWQNKVLFEYVHEGLTQAGWEVLSHQTIPANDGGLALGQAMVAAARLQSKGAN